MDRTVKQPKGGEGMPWILLFAVLGLFGAGEAVGVSLWLGESLYGAVDQDLTWHPLRLVIGLMAGELVWTGGASAGAVTLAAVAVVLGVGYAGCRRRRWRVGARIRREAIDSQVRYMARGGELAGLRHKQARAKAEQLKVRLAKGDPPGVMIARAVADGRALYASYEDLHLDIWGPRSGKSTSRVIPAVMDAVGAVVATSNKRDVVDATRRARAMKGRVFVFDPQGVAEEACSWFWDPLDWVLGEDGGADAQERAARLAGHFAAAGEADARDAFFDPEGEDLLAGLVLAAALARLPITQVYRWVTKSDDQEPIEILDSHGYDLLAGGLSDQYYAPDKQRAGVFSTAKKMAACLRYRKIWPWVTAPAEGEGPRDRFTVAEFVRSRDTLYPLSQEGKGGVGPLVAALCAAIGEEGTKAGIRSPGGRLPVPVLIVLDEAANIVKWADLPKQYSHFGSRGIVVMTILQSWAQGVRCWGEDGMRALWSAANVKILGAGLDDHDFLEARSKLIGSHHELAVSVSRGTQSRSVSTSRTTEPTLCASDLAALPKGRVVVFSSGNRPTLGQAVPWMERPYAEAIRAALADAEQSQVRGARLGGAGSPARKGGQP